MGSRLSKLCAGNASNNNRYRRFRGAFYANGSEHVTLLSSSSSSNSTSTATVSASSSVRTSTTTLLEDWPIAVGGGAPPPLPPRRNRRQNVQPEFAAVPSAADGGPPRRRHYENLLELDTLEGIRLYQWHTRDCYDFLIALELNEAIKKGEQLSNHRLWMFLDYYFEAGTSWCMECQEKNCGRQSIRPHNDSHFRYSLLLCPPCSKAILPHFSQ